MQKFTAKQYLAIDIVNNFGLDKKTWNERLDWFDKNQHNLWNMVEQAETPALFYAGLVALRDMNDGKPSGYPISLDATASGVQILACLVQDRKAAQLCNVIDTGTRKDAYTEVYNAFGTTTSIVRKDIKQAVMCALYGSTAVPKEVFKTPELLDQFYTTMEKMMPEVWELNSILTDSWDPTATVNSWVLPDNFHVNIQIKANEYEPVNFMGTTYQTVRKVIKPVPHSKSLSANITHSIDGMIVRELTRRCSYDRADVIRVLLCLGGETIHTNQEDDKLVKTLWKHFTDTGFLSARILQHIGSTNVHMIDPELITIFIHALPKKPFQILSIHDCYRVLPAYANDLREQYNILLSMITKSNLLNSIYSQLTGSDLVVQDPNDTMWVDVLDANYALS